MLASLTFLHRSTVLSHSGSPVETFGMREPASLELERLNSGVGVHANLRPSVDRTLVSRPPAVTTSATRKPSEGVSLAPCALGERYVLSGLGNPCAYFWRGDVIRFVGTERDDNRGRRSVTAESVGTGSLSTLPDAEFHQDWSLRRRVGIVGGLGRSTG